MTNYSIKIKKGEIEYSISSADKEFIAQYIVSFFQTLKNKSKPFENVTMPKLYAEKTITNPIQAESPKSDIPEESQEKTIDEMVKSLFDKSAEDTIINIEPKNNKNKTINEDLSGLTNLLEPKIVHGRDLEIVSNDFDFNSILEDKISNPVYEEIPETKNFNYDELLKLKQPESAMDYLIITAYYMLENENVEAFQLKQLNAKLFNSMNMVIDRKTIHKAIEDGLVTVVSDGIQNDGAVEYALTRAGQEFYTNGLA